MLKSFFHWKVGVNILLALAIFSGLVWATFKWLTYHTNHGKEVPVPNIVNMPVNEAVKVLEDMGLAVEVDSFKFDPKYKPFQVLQIYPSAGSRVKEGRAIMLKVNPRTWAKVEVPDILDKYKGLAFSRLELVGLKIGDTLYEANIQRDAVIRMEMNGTPIKPGMLLPKFSVVNLVIGTGPMRNIAVPNIVGLTVKEAREVIKKSHFELGVIDYADTKDEEAIVYYQDPDRGALRDQGMQVDIWVSSKTPAEMQSKIRELDKIYRMYDVVEETGENNFNVPIFEEPISRPKAEESKKIETPKDNTTSKSKSHEKEQKQNTQKSNTTEQSKSTSSKPKDKVEEKPKTNRVVIE